MKKSLAILTFLGASSLTLFPARSNAETIEAGLELHLGQAPERLLLVPIESIQTAVTVQLIPIIDCPGFMKLEFDLRKVNSATAFPVTISANSMTCTIDSIHIDSSSVYEVPVPGGAAYYMRPLRREGSRLRVRLTSELPVDIIVAESRSGHDRVGVAGSLSLDSLKNSRTGGYLTSSQGPIAVFKNPTPTICPALQSWELPYKRVNPAPGRFPISVQVGPDCRISDSVALDTGIVYEYYSAYDVSGGINLRYFLKIAPGPDRSIQFRLATENPLILAGPKNKAMPMPSGANRIDYGLQADGRKIRMNANHSIRNGSILPFLSP